MKLKINPELRDLLPPLGPEELEGLEAGILRDGCTYPLTVWDEVIVDGHHRYAICTKHGLSFRVESKDFDSIDDAKIWMCERQNNQRNLTLYQRAVIALKMKPIWAEKAKQNQKQSKGHGKKGLSNLTNLNTRFQISKKFKISAGTLHMVEFLEKYASEEVKQNLRADQTKISKEYKRLKAEIEAKTPSKPKKNRATKATTNSATTTKSASRTTAPKPLETKSTTTNPESEPSFRTGLYCRPGEKPGATGEPYVTSSSLTDLPHNQPEVLVAQLIAHFPREYARKCPFLILDALRANDGSETTIPLAKDIIEEFGER